jgi:hypothetical protein
MRSTRRRPSSSAAGSSGGTGKSAPLSPLHPRRTARFELLRTRAGSARPDVFGLPRGLTSLSLPMEAVAQRSDGGGISNRGWRRVRKPRSDATWSPRRGPRVGISHCRGARRRVYATASMHLGRRGARRQGPLLLARVAMVGATPPRCSLCLRLSGKPGPARRGGGNLQSPPISGARTTRRIAEPAPGSRSPVGGFHNAEPFPTATPQSGTAARTRRSETARDARCPPRVACADSATRSRRRSPRSPRRSRLPPPARCRTRYRPPEPPPRRR